MRYIITVVSLACLLAKNFSFAENLDPVHDLDMVTIPSGTFLMGGTDPELKNVMGYSQEYPATEITVSAFEISAYETTFALWDQCYSESGCLRRPDDGGFGRDQHPVINVSYEEINDEFLPWLNQKTGKNYRLPSEAEWEYAARGGTTSRFYTGDCITTAHENFSGERHPRNNRDNACEETEGYNHPLAVGSLLPNPFGLYDMLGNVSEVVEDCYYHKDYDYKYRPTDGRPYTRENCFQRHLRGCGYWCTMGTLRVSRRNLTRSSEWGDYFGFRLAHSIPQENTDQTSITTKQPPIIELLNLFDE
ncbi:SUMF1/EgtB/PvdO family nonheme iron enzyme [Halomonas sp. ISL-60]|uniref:formylglycine-generating enzyme family protein n=1 Tax=Halomonas sp. ISL-56 TaxID=2819149 RepID=UPI001BE9227D|nr:formylglycine-generating enzyme family protein [Halomonas sp. ISL-56]MBT2773354.1 SUMF1/EgtB/PvdO family nonheme iron enzyme [Halomonas sp. ISL-60]MBT2802642.1 SUMF1/EgtB/PvdO family nonheme iron enzyme [Halomonas sp. ISL-56]